MTALEKLAALRQETQNLCASIMSNPEISEADFDRAFKERDKNYVEGLLDSLAGDDEDLRAMHEGEMRWETMCGCNGADSPFHSYFFDE